MPVGKERHSHWTRAWKGIRPNFYFTAIGSSSEKWLGLQIGTDMLPIITSIGDELFRVIDIDDLEPPPPSKNKGF